jgi:hypothetical protein
VVSPDLNEQKIILLDYNEKRDEYSLTSYFGRFLIKQKMLIDTMSDWTILSNDDYTPSDQASYKLDDEGLFEMEHVKIG